VAVRKRAVHEEWNIQSREKNIDPEQQYPVLSIFLAGKEKSQLSK
jgi:hypothetical protein